MSDEQDERADELEDETRPRTDPRDDEAEGADEQPQPWAKALPGDADSD